MKEEFFFEFRILDVLLFKIVIVGCLNVGKFVLFNRIVGGDIVIVYDEVGVIRDRLYICVFWSMYEFMLVDIGGVLMILGDGSDVVVVIVFGGEEVVVKVIKEVYDVGLFVMIEK